MCCFFDENYITNFAKTHTKEASTIKDWFNRLVARIRQAMDKVKKYVTEYRAISDDIAEVERIRDLFNAALGERNANNTTNNTNVKYSNKNIDFERNIDEWDKEGRSNDETFIIGNTGDVLQGLGAIDNQIYFYGKKINAILKKHRDSMTLDIIKKVPDIIDNPALVLSSHSRSKSNNTRLLLFDTVKGSNGKPIMSVLDLQPFENGLLISDMQKLTSAYPLTRGQNGIRNYLNNCDVLYVTENKKTATKLVRQIGFFDPKKGLPIGFQQSGFIGSISYKNQNVNIQGKSFSDVFNEQAVKNEKVKFSTKNSEQFNQWFGNSMVVNKDGTPKVVYHNTNARFTVFDTTKSGSNQGKTHGDGIYLSTNPYLFDYAGDTQLKMYASISNPFEMYLTDKEATSIYDKYFKPFHDDKYGTYKPHVLQKLQSPTGVFDYLNEAAEQNKIQTIDILKELGYDGVHDGVEWVAFDSNQVKLTDNLAPTNNEDIRFSVKQPVEETKDLIAIHNTTEEKLLSALELGGLPSPSIAIMKVENTRGNNDFGNISLNITSNKLSTV